MLILFQLVLLFILGASGWIAMSEEDAYSGASFIFMCCIIAYLFTINI